MKIVFSVRIGVIVVFALLKMNIQNFLKNVMISVNDVMMMSEKRFIVPKQKDDEFYWNIIDTENGKVVLQHISLIATREMCTLLNELDYECTFLLEQREHLKDDCKQLEQQYHNLVNAIVKTCNDLNNTEEVYLADFNVCKRITEYEKELLDNGR